ncbi:hypothetical protein [Streptomyces sp. C10]|uniref:hypothetical protein n=1 Tax=Streptomyces sp. C10 TaxID=531941 RepID=UPI00397F6C14
MNLSFEKPPAYDLGAEADLGMWLSEWGEYADRIVHLGPDDGRDHGQLCWDVLVPTGLLAPHCGECKHRHGGPQGPKEMESALRRRIPPPEPSVRTDRGTAPPPTVYAGRPPRRTRGGRPGAP